MSEVVAAMRLNNPRLREAWAAYHSARAVAKTPTPLLNPTLSAGPLLFSGASVLSSARYGVEAALGWTLQLGGARAATDDLNALRAQAALAEAAGAERSEYLELRNDFVRLAFVALRLDVRREVAVTARRAADAGRRLIEAAQATALDLRVLELEAARSESTLLAEDGAISEARARIAARLGLSLNRISSVTREGLAPLPSAIPTPEELHLTMLRDHPELAILKAQYLVAEQELRLEIRRQIPALDLGASYEREDRVDRFGLPFGIELPIFDGNQQGIARATSARAAARVKFEVAVAARLAAVEFGLDRLRLAQGRFNSLRTAIAPLARGTVDMARAALPAGAVDALRFLEVLRVDREVRLDIVAAEADLYNAWLELEQACGAPLLRFPNEPSADRLEPLSMEGEK